LHSTGVYPSHSFLSVERHTSPLTAALAPLTGYHSSDPQIRVAIASCGTTLIWSKGWHD